MLKTLAACPRKNVLATEAEILQGFQETFYGVPITEIGEDGDAIAAFGHPEPRRLLAAMLAFARSRGWGPLDLNLDTLPADAYEKAKTWRLIYRHADAATVHASESQLEGECICEECHWWAVEATESTPGATPVIWWVL